MTELEIQRALTHAFILTMPVTITLRPRNRVKGAAGGFTWRDAVPRAAQVMRLIEPGSIREVAPTPLRGGDGVQREIAFTLLGEWNATIGQFDTFHFDGHDFEVVEVAQSNGWEQRASVVRLG